MEQANNIHQLAQGPTVNAPSISSSAMLVQLNISTWTARKLDKSASRKVARDNGASAKAGNYNKNLLAGCTELEDLKKIVGNARTTHYAMTLPWSDMGLRLIPTSQYFDYQNTMTDLEHTFRRMYQDFEDAYQWRTSTAMSELGAMFSHADYPPVDELRRKFGWNLAVQPLPEAGDFRLDIPNEQQEVLKQQYDSFYRGAIESAMNDIWARLHKNLETVLRQLSPKDETNPAPTGWTKKPNADGSRKYNKLYDSVFDTSLELIHMMRDFNLTGDTQMTAIADQLENALYGVNTDALKASETLRLDKQQQVKDIISKLPSLDL